MAAWDTTTEVSRETRRLEAELARALEQLEQARGEGERLSQRLADLEADHTRICDQYVEAMEQSGNLVQQAATLQQIHGAPTREALLQALQEIVINVLGSEELAIFDVEGGALELARAFGVDAEGLGSVRLGQGILGRVAQSGTRWLAGRGDLPEKDAGLTVCLPLLDSGQVVGLLAIWRLLGHKLELTPADVEILDLLELHAGRAMHLKQLSARAA